MLLYMKRIHDNSAAGEAMRYGLRVTEVLKGVQKHHLHREGTDGWNIPNMCGAYLLLFVWGQLNVFFRFPCLIL